MDNSDVFRIKSDVWGADVISKHKDFIAVLAVAFKTAKARCLAFFFSKVPLEPNRKQICLLKSYKFLK